MWQFATTVVVCPHTGLRQVTRATWIRLRAATRRPPLALYSPSIVRRNLIDAKYVARLARTAMKFVLQGLVGAKGEVLGGGPNFLPLPRNRGWVDGC